MHDVLPKPSEQRTPTGLWWDGRGVVAITMMFTGVLAAVLGTVATWTGDIPGLPGTDPLVRFGLPTVRVLLHLVAASTVGLALLPLLSAQHGRARTQAALTAARRAAIATALLWVLCCLVSLPLQAAEVAPGSEGVKTVLRYTFGLPAATGLLVSGACALVTAALSFVAARGREMHPVLAPAFAILGLVPVPLTGHLTTGGAHGLAVLSVELHVVGAAVWTGGLFAVALCLAPLRGLLATTLPRYSTLAGVALALVGLSGLVNAVTELVLTPGVGLAGLVTTRYGQLVLVKAVFLVVLGALGAHVRWRLLPRILRHHRTALLTWIGAELGVMGLAYGLGAVLARTPVG
ncbi:copper resistance protein CopD [Allosaccharopolyspora coralli]|uniref:Copper resistance protein CopD n=1 Tax=Allosaccharopolyspora coralli TaxID=2665642 RepID=A0A5Q3Q210_9PSEU|nr:CopD family protein [Allosaccharopolyspora coralli]QGK68618.1 copper resistance protein CopD [Allosaccharopolyspora coralli]